MSARLDRAAEVVRANAVGFGAGAVLLVGGIAAVRFVVSNRAGPPPPKKVMQFTMVNVQPPPPPRPLPTPPPQPREEIQQHTTRVTMNKNDFQQPDLSRPAPAQGGGGRLSLAAEGTGPGDAFNLVGNPGGRGLLSGGGLGDGTGDELGEGGGAGNRFGWYYTRVASELEAAFRKNKSFTTASTRVELRLWASADGRVSKIEPVHSTGNPDIDEAIRAMAGMQLSQPPPADAPMPMILRVTARRLQ
jgi:outer membrane biosynthesis protein TonB